MTPGCSQFGPQGHHWQDLCRVPLKHCYKLNVQALGMVVSEENIFSCYSYYSCYKPLTDNDAPGGGQFEPQGAWLAGLIKGIT